MSCDVRKCNEADAVVMFRNMVGKKPDIVEWHGNRVYIRYSKPTNKRVSFTLYEHEASFEFYTGVDNIRFDGMLKDPKCLKILNEHVAQGKPPNIKDYL